MFRNARRILAVAVITIVCLGATALTAAAAHHYPKSATKAFVRGCVGAGGTRATCSCIITALERRDSYKKFQGLALRLVRTGKLPKQLRSVSVNCARAHQ